MKLSTKDSVKVVERVVKEKVVEKEYHLTLTEREIKDLYILVGKIGGNAKYTIRETTDPLYEKIWIECGFPYDCSYNKEAMERVKGLEVLF